jgi:flagellar biosynthesis protein
MMPTKNNRPKGQAVALQYREDQRAPRVVAKGYGVVAETIIDRARNSGVYVHESAELVSLLMQIDLDAQIPPQLYVVIAELLAWLYKLEHGAAGAVPPTVLPPEVAALLEGAEPLQD